MSSGSDKDLVFLFWKTLGLTTFAGRKITVERGVIKLYYVCWTDLVSWALVLPNDVYRFLFFVYRY